MALMALSSVAAAGCCPLLDCCCCCMSITKSVRAGGAALLIKPALSDIKLAVFELLWLLLLFYFFADFEFVSTRTQQQLSEQWSTLVAATRVGRG